MTNPYDEHRAFTRTIADKTTGRIPDEEIVSLRAAGAVTEIFKSVAGIPPYLLQKHWPVLMTDPVGQDVIQEGNIGILMAINSWKYGAGSSFDTWAFQYAKRYMSAEVDKQFNYNAHNMQHDFSDVPAQADSDYSDEIFDSLHPHDWDSGGEMVTESAAKRAMEWEYDYQKIRNSLPRRDAILLDLLCEGCSVREMARFFCESTSVTGRRKRALEERLARQFG